MPRLFPVLALAAAASFPTVAAAQLPTPPLLQGTRLDVVASGESKRVPDIAAVSAGVVTQAADAAGAMRANAARMAAVIAALRKAGVAERDIATTSVSLNPQYRYGENVPPVITGYQALNTVTVRFRDVAKSGTILDALVAQGANQINGPNLTLDDPSAAEDEARVDALAKARARATLYAGAAGLRVKRIVSISESGGYAPPPMPYATMRAQSMEKDASTQIAPGEQIVAVTVSVSFELE